MMNRHGHNSLEHECLQTTLKEVLHSKGQHAIKLVPALIQQPIPVHSPHKGFTFNDSSWVLLLKNEKHSCSITDTAKSILHPPEFSLTLKTILSNEFQLSIQTLLLIWTSRLLESFSICNTFWHLITIDIISES